MDGEEYAKVDGRTLYVELQWPRSEGRPNRIEIDLNDVRATSGLIVTYDFDRDGWRIGMRRTQVIDGAIREVAPDDEMAFIPAWNEPDCDNDFQTCKEDHDNE